MGKTLAILIISVLPVITCNNLPNKNIKPSIPSKLKTKTLKNTIVTKRVPVGSTMLQGRMVTFSNNFYIGQTEVTWAQWHEVAAWASNPARGSKKCTFQEYHAQKGSKNKGSDRQPVTHVSWDEAVDWCNALSEKEGLTPVYSELKGNNNPVMNPLANGYRLPTEAEWEYAARYIDGVNWTPENYLSGATSDYTNEEACIKVAVITNSKNDMSASGQWISLFDFFSSHTKKVKSKKANALGLYDMSGNVHEWCWDVWSDTINTKTPVINPLGPDEGFYRTYRGGSFNRRSSDCLVSSRFVALPYFSENGIGFRIVRNDNNK